MLAAAHVIRTVVQRGGSFISQAKVTRILVNEGSVSGIETTKGNFSAPIIVNATGTWAGELAQMAGSHLPIAPRKGFLPVTEPTKKYIFHKGYDSAYDHNVASSYGALPTNAVVKGTHYRKTLIATYR